MYQRASSMIQYALFATAVSLVANECVLAQPPEPARPADSTRPLERPPTGSGNETAPTTATPDWLFTETFPPLGFTGPSSVLPREVPSDGDYIPMEDRWRLGMPALDRYGKKHPPTIDYPFQLGHWWDPYNQNVLKGDFPIIGQNIFFNLTGRLNQLVDTRQTPIPTTPFESTANPYQEEFYGKPNQLANFSFLSMQLDLFQGDTLVFRPIDWRLRVVPFFNVNVLNVEELAVVNPNVLRGVQRDRTFFALQEWFFETKIADSGPYYDFASVRAGSQYFNNDFRGFLYSDTNRMVRLFGTRFANQDQFNLVATFQSEKDTNSGLNSFDNRQQNVYMMNYYHQDFLFPGYTVQGSIAYNHDNATGLIYDKNSFLVRPEPVGVFRPHAVDVAYFGLASDGHIGRYNISSQFYYALGNDTLNALANQQQDISAAFAAIEASYDRDYTRFRTSFLWASGDRDPNNSHATGFDAPFPNENFAGGNFSYWQRQSIKLFGTNLTNAGSLLPDLRTSRIQGQTNFVNPGLLLLNGGIDVDVTPKLKLINNVNMLWFESSKVLEQYVYASGIDNFIGTDISVGCEYRPLLSNNAVITFGASTLIPGSGFKSLYNKFQSTVDPPVAGFVDLVLQY